MLWSTTMLYCVGDFIFLGYRCNGDTDSGDGIKHVRTM